MNERINKLFGQAMDQAIPETWTTLTHSQLSILKDKFAELLVRDVLDVCGKVNKDFEQWTETHYIDSMQRQIGVNHCRLAIKEHFGINE